MKQALQGAGFLCLLVWAFVGARCVVALDSFTTALQSSQQAIVEARLRMVQTSQNTNAVLIQVGLAADQWRRASEKQGEYSRQLTRTLDNTDGLVSDARKAVQTLDREVQANGEASQKAIAEATAVISDTGRGVANLSSALAPVGAIAKNLEQVSAEAVGGSRAGAQVARNLQGATAHLESAAQSVDEALKPLRTTGGKLKAVLKWLLNVVKVNIR